jgi:hypothetical protein
MSQSQIHSAFKKRLLPGEQLIAVVENLSFGFHFVPHIIPTGNYPAGLHGALALTNRRVIALWQETRQSWKWLHIPALNSVSERPLRSDKPSWPCQAIMMLPGGIGLVVQTRQPSAEHSKQLLSLLNKAIVRLGVQHDDTGAIGAIITYEEEEERRRRERE